MKKGIHSKYFKEVQVNCICGATFTVNTTVEGPIKVETCYQCHPVFNKDRIVKKPVKGMMEKYLEKQKRIEAARKANYFIFTDLPRGKYNPDFNIDKEIYASEKNIKRTVR